MKKTEFGTVAMLLVVGSASCGSAIAQAQSAGGDAESAVEWPTYGGQDMRTADERWQLERKRTYWVRIGKLRRRGAEQVPSINARTAPVRVP